MIDNWKKMRSEKPKQKNLPIFGPRQVVYKNDYHKIYRVNADFDAYSKEYFVADFGWHSGIVVLKNASILLVRQYRLLIDRYSWEIPGGSVDDRETPETAAVRECLEETGIRCFNPRPLIFYHVGLDTTYCPTYIFYADETSIEKDVKRGHKHEISGFEWIPLTRCLEMIYEQTIMDSFTILALFAYNRMIKQSIE